MLLFLVLFLLFFFPFFVMLCGGSRLLVRALLVQQPKKGSEAVLVFWCWRNQGGQLALALRQATSYQVKGFIDQMFR